MCQRAARGTVACIDSGSDDGLAEVAAWHHMRQLMLCGFLLGFNIFCMSYLHMNGCLHVLYWQTLLGSVAMHGYSTILQNKLGVFYFVYLPLNIIMRHPSTGICLVFLFFLHYVLMEW